jgi:hypothetical protein
MEHIEQSQENSNDLNLQDILLLIREYFREIKKRWYFLIPFIGAVGAYYAYQHHKEGIKYPASITFMVNEEEGVDPTGGIGALLKSFGGKSNKDGSALEKVLQLFRARSIIESAMFKKVTINSKEDYIANHIINIYTLDKLYNEYSSGKWLDPIRHIKSHSFKSTNIESYTNEEKMLLTVLYEAIAGYPSQGIQSMILPTLDDKSNIMSFGVTTDSQELTVGLLDAIYAQLSEFYVKQTVEKQQKIFELVGLKKDSLANELASADASLAKFEDSNRSLVWVSGELVKVKLQRKARIAEVMYAEVVKQHEMADFALRRKIPFVNVIDRPRLPLRPVKMSIGRSVMITTVFGTFLGIIAIILRKIITDAWQKALKSQK